MFRSSRLLRTSGLRRGINGLRAYGSSGPQQSQASRPILRHIGKAVLPFAIGFSLAWYQHDSINEVFETVASEGKYAKADNQRIDVSRKSSDSKDGYSDFSVTETVPYLDQANADLRRLEQSRIFDEVRVDTCGLPSNNTVGEDRFVVANTAFNRGDGIEEKLLCLGIYDGHAGHKTADLLQQTLHHVVFSKVSQLHGDGAPKEAGARPQSHDIEEAIKSSFVLVDADIIETAKGLLEDPDIPPTSVKAINRLAPALSGSCALLSLYEPSTATLRVACTGDSRAVFGRAGWTGNYSASSLSVDQTGFNASEVARITAEHPSDEKIIDAKTGRIHGLAVVRAFGDARWKWPDETMKDAQQRFWSHGPRPGGVIKTPPYLTARPEVQEIKVKPNSSKPDFLIMASDGFWDIFSNDDAVLCVQKWIEAKKRGSLDHFDPSGGNAELRAEDKQGAKLGQDLFVNDDKALEWRVKPEHFVVEDSNCATHLIKNALGGKRRSLFCGLVGLAPPLSRDVRDDITVHVVFFGKV